MGSLFRQCIAVTELNIKSLPQRLQMSIATIVAVAMAVAVLLGFLALSNGFRATMEGNGAKDVAIVVREGADSELSSVLTVDQLNLIDTAPGVMKSGDTPLVSKELYLVVDAKKRATGTDANMTLRGVSPEALAVRHNVHITQGRMFTPGTNEIVAGKGLLHEFTGFELNREVKLGANVWKVVGVFEAPGSVFESELWADAHVVQGLFGRGNSYQTARARLTSEAAFPAFQKYIENDPRLHLHAATERDYYAGQAGAMSDLITKIGWPLGIVMAIGAIAGALNTMYSSVAARSAEIATLRIIGFSGAAAFFGTLIEALALSVIGALVGSAFCYLAFDGMTASTLNGASFTQVVFQLKLTPFVVLEAIIMAIVIGLIGGIFPGIRAARQSPQIELAAQ